MRRFGKLAALGLLVVLLSGCGQVAPEAETIEESTVYCLQYIASSPIEKLYTFAVTDTVLGELEQVAEEYMKRFVGRDFKSLEVLQTLS